jgi:3',5'-cyclic AMP phosphodiesterase CpdA
MTIRLAHFSDIHVSAPRCGWRLADWFNKRLFSWMNLRLLGRGYRFRHNPRVLGALAEELGRGEFDRVIFSGDATAMGFDAELARATRMLGLERPDVLPGLAVPGNHDYCTRSAARSGDFERRFARWQEGERIGAAIYPFAQRVGDVWLIGVNSATANRWAWDARGGVGLEQLRRLEELLQRLEGGPRVLVTHYPVRVASGRREPRIRALRDLDALVDVAWRGGVGLWLHGHRHKAFHHLTPDFAPFPVICAGSATQTRRWSYSHYTLSGASLHAVQRVFDSRQGRFKEWDSFELKLPWPATRQRSEPA